uniref:Beta/gamma crystallin 'Greek key' domain-containing protein n=1 Tax=Anabas testudineus TaxID=64144 RepID=A0A3Q1ISK4_ANATE
MSIKERAKNFIDASIPEAKPAQAQKPATSGMSQKLTPLPVEVSVPESANLSSQGKLDTKGPLHTTVSETTAKPDGQDTSIAQTLVATEQSTDSKITNSAASKTANQGKICNIVESDVSIKGTDDLSEMPNNISPQSKGPSRTGSRSKRRKSKEPMSPASPNGENKPTLKQQQVDYTDKTVSASKQLTEKVSSDKAQRNSSDEQLLSDSKEKPFKEAEVLDKPEKQIESSFKMQNIDKPINRQGELPANQDEPDTAACKTGTKSVDKDPIVLPQKVEETQGHSVVFTQDREMASKDSTETPSPSPLPVDERPIEKTLTLEQESPVEHPKLDKQSSMQIESKSKDKVRQPSKKDPEQTQQPQNKDTEIINQVESKREEKLKKGEKEKNDQSNKKDEAQPLCSNTNTMKGKDSVNGQGISGTEGSVVKNDDGKKLETKDKTQPIKDTDSEAKQQERASQTSEKTSGSSDLCAPTHCVGQTETTHPDKATVSDLTNEAVSGTQCDKGPLKGETAANVPPELQTKSTESPGREKNHVVSAAEPQPNSVSVEKTENSPDDSHTHGAHDDVSSSKPITKATTAVEEASVKATNDTPLLITAQTDNMGEKESLIKEPTVVSASESVSSVEAGQDDGGKNTAVKSVPSEIKTSGDIINLAQSHPQCEESKKTMSTSDTSSLKEAGTKISQRPSESRAAKSTVNVTEKTAEKTFKPPVNELSPVANGDSALRPQLLAVEKKLLNNKPIQTPKALTSPEANKRIPDSIQRSSMKKLHFPRELNKDDSSKWRDTPSSWLDVDLPKQKLKVPEPKLSSSGSESNLLDTSGELDDNDFVEKIKKLCAPFSVPPRKHNHLRPPQPPFAMPAIKEDRFEKTFDPEEFKIGLRRNKFTLDTTPSLLAQLQTSETKSIIKPARASLADRSMLLSSLDTHSRLREKTPVNVDENKDKGEKEDQIKVKSRLEGSCVFSSLINSKGKRNGLLTQVDGTSSGDVSPSETHVLSPPPLSKQPLSSPMVLFEKAQHSGQSYEIYRDVPDATSLQLSPVISVQVVRGCWILYEKPDFQGRCIALEEGGNDLTNVWAESELETEPQNSPPMLIGSIRLAVWDYSIPHIDLFTEPEGHGRVTPYNDDTIETGSFGIPLSTASIQVHSGVWLVFSDPGFQGMVAVLETGVYPFPETWGFPSPFVGSLRPLKMSTFVTFFLSQAVVYENPHFEGSCLEIDSDVFSFCDSEEDFATEGELPDSKKLKTVGSLKISGGLWVGYSQPGFEGQQYILEEGEYLDCSDWGGSEQLLSLRPILADFVAPHLKMFNDRDFGELGVNIDLTGPVINMDDTGYGMKTQSIEVIGGVWVVFEEPGFCGESYILEKGLYGSPEDWGALQPRVASAMPVVLVRTTKVQLFSDPGFQGSVLPLEDSVATLQDGFSVGSCKVLAGSWLAFEGQDFTGRMYVLEVGSYPDLRAMGYDATSSSIQSLQTTGFEFSLPSITLFERCGLRGKRVVLTDGSVNLQLAGGCSRVQSVLVEGAMWILYERINYQGTQILLKPGEILDWRKFSSWQKIGSLRPLIQKQVHFRLRNRQTGLLMSVTGSLDDVKLMRIQETEENEGLEQIWFYQNGHLHCKLLEECCLSPSGSVTMAGSRVGLSPEPDMHLWSITPEGFIRYTPTSDLVLEVKGGHHYDKNQVILNPFDPNKLQQRWNVEII